MTLENTDRMWPRTVFRMMSDLYGSDVSPNSPWNNISQDAPIIVDRTRKSYGYFSANDVHHDRTRIDWLVAVLDYYDKTSDLAYRWSEHGLGHLLNPTDPESEDREWIAQAWLSIVRRAYGLSTTPLGIESSPAVGQITVSSPAVMKPLNALNEGKSYPDRIKPFNFLLACHVRPLGHPRGVKPDRFHLIAPYETDSRKWLTNNWIDQYSGKEFRITTVGSYGGGQVARVKTYGDVLLEYEYHPESKCADSGGNICSKQTIGLLQRRHIRIDQIKYIGKESNSLEEVDAGLVHSEQNVYTEFPDPRRDEWRTKILSALRTIPLTVLEEMSELSRRALIDIRAGRSRPHRKNHELLVSIVKRWESKTPQ